MKLFFPHKTNILLWAALIGFILNLAIWIYTFWLFQTTTDLIPLHYTIYFGIDLIDYKSRLFLYPSLGLIILGINSILTYLIKKEKLIGYFLVFSAILAQIFILITQISLVTNYY
ncbi:MAG: hypothetical protein ABH896_03095 [Candidatus Jacksonbacteria bacterium]